MGDPLRDAAERAHAVQPATADDDDVAAVRRLDERPHRMLVDLLDDGAGAGRCVEVDVLASDGRRRSAAARRISSRAARRRERGVCLIRAVDPDDDRARESRRRPPEGARRGPSRAPCGAARRQRRRAGSLSLGCARACRSTTAVASTRASSCRSALLAEPSTKSRVALDRRGSRRLARARPRPRSRADRRRAGRSSPVWTASARSTTATASISASGRREHARLGGKPRSRAHCRPRRPRRDRKVSAGQRPADRVPSLRT